ncbi:MAG: DUF3786 domain-containing protein [Oligoflexia bacterium]|nr:DUF3786 domain-containing protein [Oligoflexia bacterium]
MSLQTGKKNSILISLEKIKNGNLSLADRAQLLSLGKIENGHLAFKAFAKNYLINESDYSISYSNIQSENINEVKDDEKIFILHYLLSEIPYIKSDKLISFREFSGGQFFWKPFLERTAKPLSKKIGNNISLLIQNLNQRFDYQQVHTTANTGDFAAKIHAIGNIYLTLVYHQGDDEFPAEIDVLFDEYCKWVFPADDAVYIASKICIGLL